MPSSDFLNINLATLCDDLASELNKTYQHLPWALKNAVVERLKRKIHALSQAVSNAQKSKSLARTQKFLQDAVALTHECVPLMSLCLKKALLSQDLHDRWVKRLNGVDKHLNEWLKATDGR